VYVPHQPVKNDNIAVNRNVDLIETLLLCQIFVKILHVLQQEIPIALEILSDLLVLIAHVNQNLVLAVAGDDGPGRARVYLGGVLGCLLVFLTDHVGEEGCWVQV
jgi:hypothetical protein